MALIKSCLASGGSAGFKKWALFAPMQGGTMFGVTYENTEGTVASASANATTTASTQSDIVDMYCAADQFYLTAKTDVTVKIVAWYSGNDAAASSHVVTLSSGQSTPHLSRVNMLSFYAEEV